MNSDERDKGDAEWRLFRYMLFAAHPAEAAELFAFMDEDRKQSENYEEGYEEFAPELTDDELYGDEFEYQPFSAEEVEATIGLLRRFGGVREG